MLGWDYQCLLLPLWRRELLPHKRTDVEWQIKEARGDNARSRASCEDTEPRCGPSNLWTLEVLCRVQGVASVLSFFAQPDSTMGLSQCTPWQYCRIYGLELTTSSTITGTRGSRVCLVFLRSSYHGTFLMHPLAAPSQVRLRLSYVFNHYGHARSRR